jgi:hypothetical protein
VPPPAQGETRGLIGAVGKKVLKVLVFPLIDPIVGEIGDYLAARWEKARRPYRLRTFTPQNYASPDAEELQGPALERFGQGRSLLIVHGTFSRAHIGYGALPAAFVETLSQRYQGRVFAFDHFTLSDDPTANVRWFLEHVPSSVNLDLDIICHSRGGLVSRVMSEMQEKLSLGSRSLKVGRVIFVAAPNAGTILTDVNHLGSLVDGYTNLLNFFPDNGVTEVLEAVITVVKQLAVGAVKGMEGLYSMAPKGDFLTELNKGAKLQTKYAALASNFEPRDQGLKSLARDIFFDKLFAADNDLIVPTGGVYEANGSEQFPIEDHYVFPAEASVHHGGFFGNSLALEKMLAWLPA